jgi:DNA-binding response OmpR family regulator
MSLKILNTLNLLYVEDDKALRTNYLKTLNLLFYKVHEAECYDTAIKKYNTNQIDILLVDINLGKLSGIELVKKIREKDIYTPIVFLTAHSDNKYLLEAINLQIDGYIIKPLDLDKLQVCMSNCIKKLHSKSRVIIDSNIYYDLNNQELYINEDYVKLGKKTNELLKFFLENQNQTITKESIEHTLWSDKTVTDSAIKNLISNLRKLIGKEKILNITGIGWKLNI